MNKVGHVINISWRNTIFSGCTTYLPVVLNFDVSRRSSNKKMFLILVLLFLLSDDMTLLSVHSITAAKPSERFARISPRTVTKILVRASWWSGRGNQKCFVEYTMHISCDIVSKFRKFGPCNLFRTDNVDKPINWPIFSYGFLNHAFLISVDVTYCSKLLPIHWVLTQFNY